MLKRRNPWRPFRERGSVSGLWRYLLLFMLSVSCCVEVDWATQCPPECRCTWVSGKKSAICKEANYNTIPSGLNSDVQVLDLSGNYIPSLPKDAFKSVGLIHLQKVYLRNCRIEKIDRDAFRDLQIMIELDLSGNSLTSLQMEAFETNERLRELKLNNNPLSKLTGTSFPPLIHLKMLDLSDCHLSSFGKKTFHMLTNLEVLLLNGNRFQYINEEVFKPLDNLLSLYVGGNPWICDCRLQNFRNWIIGRNLFRKSLRCSEPSHLANFQWDVLALAEFACKPEIVTLQISGKATDALLVYGDVGSDITLECLVHANPAPEVKWVRGGQVLTNSSKNQGKTYLLHISGENDRWVNLTILKSDSDDADEYTCVGSNAAGVVEKNLTLNFQDVPTGEGVGTTGVVGIGTGNYREESWIWILICVITILLFLTSVTTLICCFAKRGRVKTARAQDLKGTEQPADHPLMRQSHHQQDEAGPHQPDGTTPLLGDSYISPSGPNGVGTSTGRMTPGSMTYTRMSCSPTRTSSSAHLDPSNNDEYPDMLEWPRRSQESLVGSTVSTVPASSREIPPRQLNPAGLTNYEPFGNYYHVFPHDNHPQTLPHRSQDSLVGSTVSTVPGSGGGILPQQVKPARLTNYEPIENYHHIFPHHDHPHNLPYRSQDSLVGSTVSNVPGSGRGILPQQLNPTELTNYEPMGNYHHTFPHHNHPRHVGRAHSPYAASVSSFTSEPPHVIVPPPNRPGYVTLPRRPRLSSWSPAYVPSTTLASSPTGSASSSVPFVKIRPKYDNLGPRTTADGSSILSLNTIGDGGGTLNRGQIVSNGSVLSHSPSGVSTLGRPPALRSTPLPSLHSPQGPMHFDPIQENDGPSTPNGSGNSPGQFNLVVPSPQSQAQNSNNPSRLSTMPRSWKPQEPKKSAAIANAALANKVTSDKSLQELRKEADPSNNVLPDRKNVKVRPKPPPRPAKKPTSSDIPTAANNERNMTGTGSPPQTDTMEGHVQSTEGDEGTEV